MSRLRLGALAAGLSLILAVAGLAREVGRFGWSDAAGIEHVQRDLSRHVTDRARALEALAVRVARDSSAVSAAIASPDAVPGLFAALIEPLPADDESLSVTVWEPAGTAGAYRVLAWSGGPAEDVAPDILARAPTLIVAPGAGGLRLVFVQPVIELRAGKPQRIAVASAETVIAPSASTTAFSKLFVLPSSIGSVPVTSSSEPPSVGAVPITTASGVPLLNASIDASQLAEARRTFRWRVAGLVLLPWVLWLLLNAADSLRQRTSAASWSEWFGHTLACTGLIIAAAVPFLFLARAANLPLAWIHLVEALAALALVATGPASAWWRRLPRSTPARQPLQWFLEQLLGGLIVGAALVAMLLIWRGRINPTSVENWQLPTLGTDLPALASLCGVLLAQIAASWFAAGSLGILAARWGITGGRLRDWAAVALWIAPSVVLTLVPPHSSELRLPTALIVVGSTAAFGVLSLALRKNYRATSEARRLVFRFAALLAPIVAVFPLAAESADLTKRDIIEHQYAPATLAAQEPHALKSTLETAQREVDAIPDLMSLLNAAPATNAVPSQAAFSAWARTVFSRNRATSELELYNADKVLVSHFSLNVPEFGELYQTGEPVWQGSGCSWQSFAEVARYGAEERPILHAERGVCEPDGRLLGAIVLHLIPDFRPLLFVSTANPYYDALINVDRPRTPAIPGLQLVVYGWSLHPQFVSGRVAWPLDSDIDQRLYRSRQPFWYDLTANQQLYHVYFLNDRARVYALGYPSQTALQHVTRVAEAAAVLMGLFLCYLAITTLSAPLWRGRPTALGKLFHEIRASFYRKLFLFFVLAAVGPVMLFAISFGSYMTDKLRADVESEASSVAIVARRVFDELSAAQARPSLPHPGPSDDLMVLIRQMLDQDVNLYDGSQLIATSQRDLFDSGLLPTRTPARVYRDIVLDRRPVSVASDRIGPFRYSVAAAPIAQPSLGRDAVITVPLASRQRDIENEIDDLTRGVLAGTVLLVVFAAALGASVAARVSDPVNRLTRATRLIAAGRLDERLVADTADELGRLVEDFNSMTETLVAQRAELARANQLKAWAEMSRQVAHEVKNPLTPIQLAAEHLQRVHDDRGRPLGDVVDLCLTTILKQVRLLRRIASEFSTFATHPAPRLESVRVHELIESVVEPYRVGLPASMSMDVRVATNLPAVRCDRTQISRALTNLVENAFQAMPNGGMLVVSAAPSDGGVAITVNDTGVGMDAEGVRRAFEPYFSTKTGGSGLGLANAKRSVESSGGSMTLESAPGRGTTVTVMLPADRPGARATALPPSQ